MREALPGALLVMRPRPPLLRTVFFLGTTFVVAVAAVLFFVRVDRVVVARGAFEGSSRAVRAPRAGVLEALTVEPGTLVEAGELVARLDSAAIEAELSILAARSGGLALRRDSVVTDRQRRIDALQPAERTDLERDVTRAELVVDAAKKREERFLSLREDGLVQGVEVEEAVLARRLAEVGLAGARAELETLASRQAIDVSAIDSALAEIDHELAETLARVTELERLHAASALTAPVSGRVWGARASELAGRGVEPGEEIVWIAVEGVERFVAQVDDRGRARVGSGLRARLRLVGYPWLVHGTLEARVTEVADRAGPGDGFSIALELEGDPVVGPLYEGMTGTARIVTEDRVPLLRLLFERIVGSGP